MISGIMFSGRFSLSQTSCNSWPGVNIMSTRHNLGAISAFAFLTCTATFGQTSDNTMSHAEASQAASELVESIGLAFDCTISVKAIRESTFSSRESRFYYVSFEASGKRCDEAHEALSNRGKSKRPWFIRSQKPRRDDDLAKEPNLDLIHKIDPPVEM